MATAPTNPAVLTSLVDYTSGLAGATFKTALNSRHDDIEARDQALQSFIEGLNAAIGNGSVSGGVLSSGIGLSVNFSALSALVGNAVSLSSGSVGGLTASSTNYLFLRQDETWTTNTTGTPPTVGDGHGQVFLWGTAITDASTVTAVTNVRRTFQQNLNNLAVLTADPTNSISGDAWLRSDTFEIRANFAGTTKKVALT